MWQAARADTFDFIDHSYNPLSCHYDLSYLNHIEIEAHIAIALTRQPRNLQQIRNHLRAMVAIDFKPLFRRLRDRTCGCDKCRRAERCRGSARLLQT